METAPILLQVQVALPHSNTTTVIIIVSAILAAIVLSTIIARIRSGRRSASRQQKFSRGQFRRAALKRGLDQAQTKVLENLVLRYRPSAPMSIFSSTQTLDIMLRKVIEDIKQQKQPETVKQGHITTIYAIKQAIEQNSGRDLKVQSSDQLQVGQEISITPEKGSRYDSRVIGKLRNALAASIPVDESGSQVRWKKSTPVEVFFTRGGGKGFAFQTKVLGYNAVKGNESVLLQHSKSVPRPPNASSAAGSWIAPPTSTLCRS